MSISSGYPFLKYFLILLYFHMDIFVICIIIFVIKIFLYFKYFLLFFNIFTKGKHYEKEISLKGKTAIVTGGATGIGFAIASELLDADANVIILGRREEKLKEAAKNLGNIALITYSTSQIPHTMTNSFPKSRKPHLSTFWLTMLVSITKRLF